MAKKELTPTQRYIKSRKGKAKFKEAQNKAAEKRLKKLKKK